MERTQVDSSTIHAVGHDPDTNTLEIEFKGKTRNSVYRYPGVPAELHQEFLESDSLGRFFRDRIKTATHDETGELLYPHTRVEETDGE